MRFVVVCLVGVLWVGGVGVFWAGRGLVGRGLFLGAGLPPRASLPPPLGWCGSWGVGMGVPPRLGWLRGLLGVVGVG